jgi:hypothetical protein
LGILTVCTSVSFVRTCFVALLIPVRKTHIRTPSVHKRVSCGFSYHKFDRICRIRVTFLSRNKCYRKLDSNIYIMILILYHKYFYIFSQSCFLRSENDTLLGTEEVCVCRYCGDGASIRRRGGTLKLYRASFLEIKLRRSEFDKIPNSNTSQMRCNEKIPSPAGWVGGNGPLPFPSRLNRQSCKHGGYICM